MLHRLTLLRRLRKFLGDLTVFVRAELGINRYRPELHYMRGPGPKAKAAETTETRSHEIERT